MNVPNLKVKANVEWVQKIPLKFFTYVKEKYINSLKCVKLTPFELMLYLYF